MSPAQRTIVSHQHQFETLLAGDAPILALAPMQDVTDLPFWKLMAAYGGKFLVRGGRVQTLEGEWQPQRIVVLEFESAAKAKAWWSSQQYAEPKRIRQSASVTKMILVEGI